MDAAVGTGAPLRVAVSCAGIGRAARTVGRDGTPHDLASYQRVININLIGTFNLMRIAAAAMARTEPADGDGQRGVIINTSSVAGVEADRPDRLLRVQGRHHRDDRARRAGPGRHRGAGHHHRPGIIDTPIYGLRADPEEFKAKLAAPILFPKRMGRPDGSAGWC